jgi:uncharacterized membrane protein
MKDEPKKDKKVSTSTGLESNVAAALCYSLGLVTGLLFLVLEDKDKFVRFHAMQSILANLVAFAVPPILTITIIGIVFIPIWYLLALIFWVLLIYKAYKGEKYLLPLIGKIADSQIK